MMVAKKIMFLAPIMVLASFAQAGAEDAIKLLSLSGRSYRIERIGTLTNFHCAGEDKSPECELIEQLDLQPQIDWTRLLGKAAKNDAAKKKTRPAQGSALSEMAIDRYGGPWIVTLHPVSKGDVPEYLKRYKVTVVPDFPGYKIEYDDGKVVAVDVLRKKLDWDALIKELGYDESGNKKARKSWL